MSVENAPSVVSFPYASLENRGWSKGKTRYAHLVVQYGNVNGARTALPSVCDHSC